MADVASPSRSIISPWIDAIAIGGASIVFIVPLLLLDRERASAITSEGFAWATLLINLPHFMASYRLLYTSDVRRYRWAAFYVPGALAIYAAIALAFAATRPELVQYFVVVSGAYLAWHYTGQAWGMIATFAVLDGAPIMPAERLAIRGGLRIMLAWHVTWFAHFGRGAPSWIARWIGGAYDVATWATVVSLALGIFGLARYARRTGRAPAPRVLIPWGAIYLWYALLARDPAAIFWIQIAHALQYLIFPARVELNRYTRSASARPALHMIVWALLLVAAGVVTSELVPPAIAAIAPLSREGVKALPLVVLSFVNVHHYFTDGAVWKISDPAVRRDLLAHVSLAKPVVENRVETGEARQNSD